MSDGGEQRLGERASRRIDELIRGDRTGASKADPFALFVPGRIEVLGKHTDYAGGRSLTCATRLGLLVAGRGRSDTEVRIVDATRGSTARLAIDGRTAASGPSWRRYPEALVRRLRANFGFDLLGVDLVLESDLPRASGLSSSSAFLTAIYLAVAEVNQLAQRPDYRREITTREELAGYLATIENGSDFGTLRGEAGVGTRGGSEDHTAILCSQAGHLGLYRYLPTRLEGRVRLPPDTLFAIAVSGVHASKAAGERGRFNRAADLAAEAARRWRQHSGRRDATLGEALESASEDEVRAALESPELVARFDQFALESKGLVPAAFEALVAEDLKELGGLVDRSQRAAEELLCNQVPETMALARLARRHGALAASAFGAGFGGSVWALVPRDGSEAFIGAWRAAYLRDFPQRAATCGFLTTPAAAGARTLPRL